jgi:hypothetical protein
MNNYKHHFVFLFVLAQMLLVYIPRAGAVDIPFTLGWNKNADEDRVQKYYIYLGRSEDDLSRWDYALHPTGDIEIVKYEMQEYVGRDRNKFRLEEGGTYYIALSAYDGRNESEKTNPPLQVTIGKILATTTSTIYSPSPSSPSYSIKPDQSPPTGTIVINKGNENTPTQFVTLYLSAEDNKSGVGPDSKMSFSNDNQEWSTPEPFNPTKSWILSFGDGIKTVYAKFCDEAGNWMNEPVSDSIELYLTCPKPLWRSATAIASSGSPLNVYSEDKTVDGKIITGWLSPLRRAPQDEHITLDLGEVRIINRIDLCSNTFFLLNLFPSDFKLQGSLDNEHWIDLFSEKDYSPPLSRSDSWSFDNTEIRYVQLVASKTKQFLFFFNTTYIAEIKIYGCAEPVIETAEGLLKRNLDQTEQYLKQHNIDTQEKEERLLQPRGVTPGRPGRPKFILNDKQP